MPIDPQIIFRIKNNDISLTSLALSECDLTDDDIPELAEALINNQTITHIDLSDNDIQNEGAKYLANIFMINKTIASINLSSNRIKNDGAIAIANSLKKNNTITCIDVSNNENFFSDKAAATAFAELFATNNTITNVNFGSTGLNAETTAFLCNSLNYSSTLVSVNFSDNYLFDKSAEPIKQLIASNKSITNMSFNNTNMTEKGIKKIYEGIQLNKIITQCNISDYEDFKSGHNIKKIVKTNKLQAKNLQKAVKKRNLELIKGLIRNGVSLNYQNKNGNTALHISTNNNDKSITTCLLKQSPSSLLKNKKGELPNFIPSQFKWADNYSVFSSVFKNDTEENTNTHSQTQLTDITIKYHSTE